MTGDRAHAGDDRDDVTMADVAVEDDAAAERADALLAGDYEIPADQDVDQDDEKDVDPVDRDQPLADAVLDDAVGRREFLAGQTHEHNAHLLFADDSLDDGLAPFFALVSEFEPADVDDDGEIQTPAIPTVGPFDAAGSTWAVDRRADHNNPDDYDKGTTKYWSGGIATRPFDAGETYYEYSISLHDVEDSEKRNRRVTFKFRPSLPEAETVDGKRIGSMPDDLPHGVRVEVNSSNVESDDVVEILQGLAADMGIRPAFYSPENIHPWSNVFGLAVYVRILRDLADDLIVGPEDGLLERLAMFSSRRDGKGEYKWNNSDVYGQRTAVALNPDSLNNLYGDHRVGKLLKSYLMKYANGSANPPEVEPTDHPKLEVQYSRDLSPYDVTIRWFDDHADGADEIGRETLLGELRSYLLNALSWAGLPTSPDDGVFVEDDHFSQDVLDDQAAIDQLELVGDPIDQVVEHERSIATKELLKQNPTDAERDVLQAATDGGRFDDLADLADDADRSTSTVSRTLDKFERLFERVDGISVADSIIRDRLSELFATLNSTIDQVERGISQLGNGDTPVDDDSALGRWAARYGATFSDDVDGLKLRLAAGNFSRYELHVVLRAGFQAAKDTLGLDELRFLDAGVSFRDQDGDREFVDRVAVWHGQSLKILGHENVFGLD